MRIESDGMEVLDGMGIEGGRTLCTSNEQSLKTGVSINVNFG